MHFVQALLRTAGSFSILRIVWKYVTMKHLPSHSLFTPLQTGVFHKLASFQGSQALQARLILSFLLLGLLFQYIVFCRHLTISFCRRFILFLFYWSAIYFCALPTPNGNSRRSTSMPGDNTIFVDFLQVFLLSRVSRGNVSHISKFCSFWGAWGSWVKSRLRCCLARIVKGLLHEAKEKKGKSMSGPHRNSSGFKSNLGVFSDRWGVSSAFLGFNRHLGPGKLFSRLVEPWKEGITQGMPWLVVLFKMQIPQDCSDFNIEWEHLQRLDYRDSAPAASGNHRIHRLW